MKVHHVRTGSSSEPTMSKVSNINMFRRERTPVVFCILLCLASQFRPLLASSSRSSPDSCSASSTKDCDNKSTGSVFATGNAIAKTHDVLSQLMKSTGSVISLPIDLSKSELALREMRISFELANVPQRQMLTDFLTTVIGDITKAGFDFQTFNAKLINTVDMAIITAQWTHENLQHMEKSVEEKDLTVGQSSSYPNSYIRDQFMQHCKILEDSFGKLHDQGKELSSLLQKLKDHFDNIRTRTGRSATDAESLKKETIAKGGSWFEFWKEVDASLLAKIEKQLAVLRTGTFDPESARNHVHHVVQSLERLVPELQEMQAKMRRSEEGIDLRIVFKLMMKSLETLHQERERTREVVKKIGV